MSCGRGPARSLALPFMPSFSSRALGSRFPAESGRQRRHSRSRGSKLERARPTYPHLAQSLCFPVCKGRVLRESLLWLGGLRT